MPTLKKISDETILKLHTGSDGKVWFIDGKRRPERSATDVAEFLDTPRLQRAAHVRVVGMQSNAHLITELYARRQADELELLEVASPLVCHTKKEMDDPATVLYRMRQCNLPPSLGGWHEVTDLDYPAYAICNELSTHGKVTERARQHAYQHPVWPALSFVKTLNTDRVCFLLGMLLDPRWYVDVDRPERTSRMESYLGLNPKTVAGVLKKGPKGRHHYKCTIAIGSWYHVGEGADLPDVNDPRNFVWRAFATFGTDRVRGLLRSTQLFVRFLRQVWLHEMYARAQYCPDNGDLFVPEHFFKNIDESKAYFQFRGWKR